MWQNEKIIKSSRGVGIFEVVLNGWFDLIQSGMVWSFIAEAVFEEVVIIRIFLIVFDKLLKNFLLIVSVCSFSLRKALGSFDAGDFSESFYYLLCGFVAFQRLVLGLCYHWAWNAAVYFRKCGLWVWSSLDVKWTVICWFDSRGFDFFL